MARRLLVLAVLVGLCAAGVAMAGSTPSAASVKEVQDLSASAVKEFEAGNGAKAVDLLQKAITVVQKTMTGNLAACLPNPPDGWDADRIKEEAIAATGAGLSQWSRVSRKYTHRTDKVEVNVDLTNSPVFVQMQETVWKTYQNAELLKMLNQNPNSQISLVDRDGWKGYTTVEKNRSVQTTLFVAGGLLTLNVSKDDPAAATQFLGLIDLKRAAQSLAGAPTLAEPKDE
jgi:hypothetical protein